MGNKPKMGAMLKDVIKYISIGEGSMYKEIMAYKEQDHAFFKSMSKEDIDNFCKISLEEFTACLTITPEQERLIDTINDGLAKNEIVISGQLKNVRDIIFKSISKSFESRARLCDLMPEVGDKLKKQHSESLEKVQKAKDLLVSFV